MKEIIQYNKLSKLLGDATLVEKYIGLVRKEIPLELDKLEKLLEDKNYKEASVIAHSIKGQCNYMGLENCSKTALTIEKQTELSRQSIDLKINFNKLKSALEFALNH